MRLQKMRSGKYSSGNLASLAASNDTLSDDDKIRHQLFLDVVNFGKQVRLTFVALFLSGAEQKSYKSFILLIQSKCCE